MKNIRILKPEDEKLSWVTIRSSMNEKNREELRQLAAALG